MSIDELARTTPVNPPTVNKNTKPKDHKGLYKLIETLIRFDNHICFSQLEESI